MTDMRHEFDDSDTQDRRHRLKATDDDPQVSVSTIGEYLFCPRAGLLSHESRRDDRGEEEQTYDLLPRYEEQAVRRAFTQRTALWMVSLGVYLGVSVGLVWLIPDRGIPRIAVLALAIAFLIALTYLIIDQTRKLLVLLSAYHHSFTGVARDFDFDDGEIHRVVWWDFYKSGFDSQDPQPILDKQWKLNGKPWRILVRGSHCIPVFRSRKVHEQPKRQQVAKVMAYCHLILAELGRVSPFGVILYGKSYEGVAVANAERHRRRFHDGLLGARKMIRESEEGPGPDAPRDTGKCSNCPWGRPRPVLRLQPTMKHGEELEPNILKSKRGTVYHCDCGDRFEWIPPHDRSQELGLEM